jgi:hypothetical protein
VNVAVVDDQFGESRVMIRVAPWVSASWSTSCDGAAVGGGVGGTVGAAVLGGRVVGGSVEVVEVVGAGRRLVLVGRGDALVVGATVVAGAAVASARSWRPVEHPATTRPSRAARVRTAVRLHRRIDWSTASSTSQRVATEEL